MIVNFAQMNRWHQTVVKIHENINGVWFRSSDDDPPALWAAESSPVCQKHLDVITLIKDDSYFNFLFLCSWGRETIKLVFLALVFIYVDIAECKSNLQFCLVFKCEKIICKLDSKYTGVWSWVCVHAGKVNTEKCEINSVLLLCSVSHSTAAPPAGH